jgi:hypothetical protein
MQHWKSVKIIISQEGGQVIKAERMAMISARVEEGYSVILALNSKLGAESSDCIQPMPIDKSRDAKFDIDLSV